MLPPVFFHKTTHATPSLFRSMNLNMLAGIPGPIPTVSPGVSGVALTSLEGQIPFPSPVAGKNTYIARFSAASQGAGGVLMLVDRLWHNSGSATNTSFSTINSVPWPARDADGTSNGRGVFAGVEWTSAGTATGSHQLWYTNSTGTINRVAWAMNPFVPPVGTATFFLLFTGDVGVRQIEQVQWSGTGPGGVVRFFAYRPLLTLPMPAGNQVYSFDAVKSGMVRCWDNTVPMLIFFPSTTSTAFITGSITYAQG